MIGRTKRGALKLGSDGAMIPIRVSWDGLIINVTMISTIKTSSSSSSSRRRRRRRRRRSSSSSSSSMHRRRTRKELGYNV